jgi:prepilin-type N-terminal cleavage/methylation domain-containing protein
MFQHVPPLCRSRAGGNPDLPVCISWHEKDKAFTLIELLIVIAIIAILSIVVVLALNPAELLRQSRDQNRLSDLDTLTHALSLYQTDQSVISGPGSLGSSTLVYVSIPDPNASTSAGSNCGSLGLPALPAGSAYHCAGPNFYRKTDGTGWLPLNFSSITTGSPLGSLPIDPQNASSSRLYYTYVTNGSKYEVTAGMESSKYKLGGSNDVITNDGGILASVYEKGSQLGLEPLDYGDPSLVGYWPMDEGSGSTAYDLSGNNASGTWFGTQAGTSGYYSAGYNQPWAGTFDGSSTYVSLGNLTRLGITNAITESLWIKCPYLPSQIPLTYLRFGIWSSDDNIGLFYQASASALSWKLGTAQGTVPRPTVAQSSLVANQWMFVAATYGNGGATIYINGVPISTVARDGTNLTSNFILYVGSTGYTTAGLVNDMRLYNRALSAAEIQALYAGGK